MIHVRRQRPGALTTLVLAAALIVAACSPGGASPPAASGPGGDLMVTLSEWKIDLSRASAPAGTVVFSIANQGTTLHEFVLIRTDMTADSLPVNDHVIDVKAMGGPMASGMDMPGMSPAGDMEHPAGTVGVIDEIAAGASAQLKLDDLAAGHYVIVCDVATHYEQGMRVDFDVG